MSQLKRGEKSDEGGNGKPRKATREKQRERERERERERG